MDAKVSSIGGAPLVSVHPVGGFGLPPGGGLDLERALDTKAGTFVERHAGDLCSLLGIVGAATLVINRRSPSIEGVGARIVVGSMAAGGLDTAIQSYDAVHDGGRAAERRGNDRAGPGSIAYAATGLIPAVSLGAVKGLHLQPSRAEVAALALLGVNGAVLGYELVTRGPKIARGEEEASGYGSLLASLGGFVVAHQFVRGRIR